MKIKCTQCKGKGEFSRSTMKHNLWLPCPQCKAKGKWYTGKKTKRRK